MIYVSSSCLKHTHIKDSVQELAEAGIKNIELSGGTKLYPNFEEDLLELKSKYDLNFRCHNYFPPPPTPFVLNLASLDDDMYNRSLEHVKSALMLSQKLEARKFGFHAGFLINISLDEIGKPIKKKPLYNKEKALERFNEAVTNLKDWSAVTLYIENNVLSEANFKNYEYINPLLMTESKEIHQILDTLKVPLLLDIAHLKVSAKTLGLDLMKEIESLLPRTDYIHISDNEGKEDSNDLFCKGDEMFNILCEFDLKEKDFTIEVYSGLENVLRSQEAIEELVNG